VVQSSGVSAQDVKVMVSDAGLGPIVLRRTSCAGRVQDHLSKPHRLCRVLNKEIIPNLTAKSALQL